MKILYGVVGEGMGHAIRSSVILEKLARDGHEIHVVVSGRAHGFLSSRFPDLDGISKIWGLTLVSDDNEVDRLMTAAENVRGALGGLPANVARYFEVEEQFEPDVVISDFETWSWLFGKVHRLPIVCIDNIQIIHRCEHPPELIAGHEADYRLAKSIVKARAPGASHYLVTTFVEAPPRKKRTTLVPPILRDIILEADSERGEHLLVYQTSPSFGALVAPLSKLDRPVYIYGLRRDIDDDVVEGNITYRPFSETQFVEDLRTCAGVVASAGFTLLGEALHLGKPYLATPVRGQFEQILNARYVERLGYGLSDPQPDGGMLAYFLDNLEAYGDALASYPRRDNTFLFEALDELLDRAGADML